ncbi:MAG: cyclic nucleotide-binding domain-containing protein [Deltaproteobacteria bacterium]|nr:cyclic nucleotide-binding domain-containing protein [Deltaproteobacteria bacterium]
MVHLEILEKVEIFRDLDDRRLGAVGGCCTEAAFQRGEEIFKVGEEARHLWAVAEGRVKLVSGSNSTLEEKEVSEGRVFGWPSLLKNRTYRFSAICAARSARVIRIDAGCLQALFEEDPLLGYKVMSGLVVVIGDHFHQLQEEVVKRRGQDMMNQW